MPKPGFDRVPADTHAAPAPATAPGAAPARPREQRVEPKESLIASGLSIEGKIAGTGHVRIAGQFKGDVHVEGNLSIEPGAKHHGEVRAATVTVSGELTGNIGAKHIDVTATGVIVGDVKADTITVASGSRMRGHVEFGWGDGTNPPTRIDYKGGGLPS
jgi:cytoskeletal protein CcmA (bactofilin family)